MAYQTPTLCLHCHTPQHGLSNFCLNCGKPLSPSYQSAAQQHVYDAEIVEEPRKQQHFQPHYDFFQVCGIHPAAAMFALAVDSMIFGGEIFGGLVKSLAVEGLMLLVGIIVGTIVTLLTYLAQRSWYKDDRISAFVKAAMLGILVAIPTLIPAFIYASAGIVGTVGLIRRSRNS